MNSDSGGTADAAQRALIVHEARRRIAAQREAQACIDRCRIAMHEGLEVFARWRERRAHPAFRMDGRTGELTELAPDPEIGWWPTLGPLNKVERMVVKEIVADLLTFEVSAPGPREWERRLSPVRVKGDAE